MKNQTNKNEEPAILITAHLEEPNMLQLLIERLAECHCDFGYNQKKMHPGWEAVETSSIETLVSGSIVLSDENDLVSIPFVTCFLFSCTKAKRGKYNLKWSCCLS